MIRLLLIDLRGEPIKIKLASGNKKKKKSSLGIPVRETNKFKPTLFKRDVNIFFPACDVSIKEGLFWSARETQSVKVISAIKATFPMAGVRRPASGCKNLGCKNKP